MQLCWAKTIFLSQISIFWIFFIQFSSAGHILSTAEVPNYTPTLISGRYFRLCVHQYGFCACWVLTFVWELYYRAFHDFSVQASGFLKSFLLVNFHYFANFNAKSVLLWVYIFSTLMKFRSISMIFVLKLSANCDLKKRNILVRKEIFWISFVKCLFFTVERSQIIERWFWQVLITSHHLLLKSFLRCSLFSN